MSGIEKAAPPHPARLAVARRADLSPLGRGKSGAPFLNLSPSGRGREPERSEGERVRGIQAQ